MQAALWLRLPLGWTAGFGQGSRAVTELVQDGSHNWRGSEGYNRGQHVLWLADALPNRFFKVYIEALAHRGIEAAGDQGQDAQVSSE
jgi:hypothetical protein